MDVNKMNVAELKEALANRGAPVSGTRSELQLRLETLMQVEEARREQKIPAPEDQKPSTSQPTSQSDLATLLLGLQQTLTSQLKSQEEKMSSQLSSQEEKMSSQNRVLQESQEKMSSQLSSLQQSLKKELQQSIEGVQAKITTLEDEVDKKLEQLQGTVMSNVEEKLEKLQNEVMELQKGKNTPLVQHGEASAQLTLSDNHRNGSSSHMKPPVFDGESSWPNFKLQFMAAAKTNKWDADQLSCGLILALRGKAADTIQSVPESQRNYEQLMNALELRYGDSHMQELHKIQLQNRRQAKGESLQQLEAEITRLARLAYGTAPANIVNSLAVDAFINAVRDDSLKLHLRTTAKRATPSEALIAALEYEAAKQTLHPEIARLKKLEAADVSQIQAMIQESLQAFKRENSGDTAALSGPRCYRCNKRGHFARACRIPRAKPADQTTRLTYQPSKEAPIRVINSDGDPSSSNDMEPLN